MIKTIHYDTIEKIITITLEDDTTKEYTQADKDAYLVDHPDRVADVISIGW